MREHQGHGFVCGCTIKIRSAGGSERVRCARSCVRSCVRLLRLRCVCAAVAGALAPLAYVLLSLRLAAGVVTTGGYAPSPVYGLLVARTKGLGTWVVSYYYYVHSGSLSALVL
eukprot:COSAG02_NODE_395_length_23127_cov_130.205663_8_plen_113_part_00